MKDKDLTTFKKSCPGKWKPADHYPDYEYSGAGFYDLGEEEMCGLYNYAELISSAR